MGGLNNPPKLTKKKKKKKKKKTYFNMLIKGIIVPRQRTIIYVDFDKIVVKWVLSGNIFIGDGAGNNILFRFKQSLGYNDDNNPFNELVGVYSILCFAGEEEYVFIRMKKVIERFGSSGAINALDGSLFMFDEVSTIDKFKLVNESNIVSLELMGYDVEEEMGKMEKIDYMNNLFIDMTKQSLYVAHLPIELKNMIIEEMNLLGYMSESLAQEVNSFNHIANVKILTEGF